MYSRNMVTQNDVEGAKPFNGYLRVAMIQGLIKKAIVLTTRAVKIQQDAIRRAAISIN